MRSALAAVWVLASCNSSQPASAPEVPAELQTGSSTVAAASLPTPPDKPAATEQTLRPHHEDHVVECPLSPDLAEHVDDEARLAALLDAANKQMMQSAYSAAWTCADRAADIAPTSVEAHHLRGAALAALGRDQEAQLAYSLALVHDPDDAETLRAVADFYINGKGGVRGRDSLRLGLELAQRGTRRVQRARSARMRTAPLAADLAVLEGQALNDLGRSDEALARIEAALRLAPGRGDALHEKGVALFDLSRFADAKAAFTRALAIQADDAYTHQMLGLTLEQLGESDAAERSLARAIELAPNDITAPVLISVAEFQREIDTVLGTLPADRRARLEKVRIEIADFPDPTDLSAVKPPFPPTILGLYRGPVGKAHVAPSETSSIVLYRKNLARAVKTRTELSEQIRDTLLHEIGHFEGLDEDDLRRRGME